MSAKPREVKHLFCWVLFFSCHLWKKPYIFKLSRVATTAATMAAIADGNFLPFEWCGLFHLNLLFNRSLHSFLRSFVRSCSTGLSNHLKKKKHEKEHVFLRTPHGTDKTAHTESEKERERELLRFEITIDKQITFSTLCLHLFRWTSITWCGGGRLFAHGAHCAVQIVTQNFDSPTLAQSITIDWQQAKRSKAIHSFKQGAGSFASEKSACIVCINDAKYLIWFDFVSVQFTICKAYASFISAVVVCSAH